MQAVTRVKLEQASKVKLWTPTRLTNGEGCTGREETPARERAIAATNKHLYRSTGVVSTACKEGDLQRYRWEIIASDIVEIEMAFDSKLIAPELGYFFTSAIA